MYKRQACARTNFLNTTIRNAECDYLVKLANESQSRSNLIISDRSLASSIALQSSLGAEQALQQLDKLELHHRLHTYDNIYVVYLMLTKQAIEGIDSFDGISSLKERLESSFKMETVDEIKFNDAIYLRCARVTEVRLGDTPRLQLDTGGLSISYTGKMEFNNPNLMRDFVASLPK